MKNFKILIVEDENIIALDIRNILQSLGFIIAGVTASGEESIEIASSNLPDLVLMDIKLKGKMDGISAAKQIYQRFHIPVIYLTALGDENTLKRLSGMQPFGFIGKPFEENELMETINRNIQRMKNFSTIN